MKSLTSALALAAMLLATGAAPAPTSADADAFVAKAEKDLEELGIFAARAAWVNATYITDDTDILAARTGAAFTEAGVRYASEAAKYASLPGLSYDTKRKLDMLRQGLVAPAPNTPGAADKLSTLLTGLQSTYGKGKGTYKGEVKSGNDLEALMGTERDPELRKEMWVSWHKVGAAMRSDYTQFVSISNAGSKELGYADTGAQWRAGYDMDPDAFAKLTDDTWKQVKPLYDQLHCYTRAKLNEKYGDAVQPKTGPIRADLLGNMWAQEWGNIYDVVAPKGAGDVGYDLTELLVSKDYTPETIVKTGEGFFSSLGFAPLPQTFWQRSMITAPRDREVVCHASAWDIDNKDDIRIKMCTKVNGDDFVTVHHELGHNYYQRAYKALPTIYRDSANDGFHEAIGDTIALSITPEYLVKIGLIDKAPDASRDLGLLMGRALEKVAFLPFSLLVDQWRWQVFSGQIAPADYNKAWWALRLKYQGVAPASARGEEYFDPGAKYHVPGNTPYTRYFLAHILQFQFHRELSKTAGCTSPLHRCSIYSSADAGRRLDAMMKMGLSKPWPDALDALAGSRQMDATAIVDYFAPLKTWLDAQLKGTPVGW